MLRPRNAAGFYVVERLWAGRLHLCMQLCIIHYVGFARQVKTRGITAENLGGDPLVPPGHDAVGGCWISFLLRRQIVQEMFRIFRGPTRH
jgi:hypothetical protein